MGNIQKHTNHDVLGFSKTLIQVPIGPASMDLPTEIHSQSLVLSIFVYLGFWVPASWFEYISYTLNLNEVKKLKE